MLEQIVKQTEYSQHLQRYYLACIDEFGEDFRKFITDVVQTSYNVGYEDGDASVRSDYILKDE